MASILQIAGFAVALIGLAWLLILKRDRLQQLWERFSGEEKEAVYDDLGPVESGRKEHEW